ncbi:MAG: hypothetical protein QNJ32_29740 [Xenococcaceae cyanobacterium MO_167.B27]|nr:hypothetical protein [Xenococcaceae cyanobacterium MO_167.B27]
MTTVIYLFNGSPPEFIRYIISQVKRSRSNNRVLSRQLINEL